MIHWYLMLRPALIVSALCAFLCACAGAGDNKTAVSAGRPPTEAQAYYPMALDWKWAYRVIQDGQDILATYSVTANDGTQASVRAGDDTITYQLKPEGIGRTDGAARGDFLLRSPVQKGATWKLAMGEARVVAVGVTVEVSAGRFDNCAVVEEFRIDPDRTGRITYAPGVGPVLIEYRSPEAMPGSIREMRAELLGFTPPGADPFAAR